MSEDGRRAGKRGKMNLIEKQKEVNEKCGFQTDNLDGLILGLISEVGELASVVALKEGLKKPKPKESALTGNISEELADVLVYFLQISIYANFEFTSLDKFRDETYPAESPSNEVISLLPILLGLSVQAMKKEENTPAVETNLCFIANILLSIAKHYEIDLQQAYLNKCKKLLER